MSAPLMRLAQRLAPDPAFVAHALARYQAQHGLDCPALAAWLGLADVNDLAPLAICTLPRPTCYASDVARIASHLGADPERLTELLADGEGRADA